MRALPFFVCKHIRSDEIAEYECSDRLVISRKALVPYYRPDKPIFLTFRNKQHRTVCGTVYQQIDEDNVVYMPTWMYQHLQSTIDLVFFNTQTQPCTSITFRLQSADLCKKDNYIQCIGNGLREYHTLTKGSCICVPAEDPTYLTIESVEPAYCTTVELVNDAAIAINILDPATPATTAAASAGAGAAAAAPVAEEEEERIIPFLAQVGRHAKRKKVYKRAFLGTAHVLGFVTPAAPIHELCMRAAERRREAEYMRGRVAPPSKSAASTET